MGTYANLLYETKGHVAKITLNRPEKLNAMSGELRDELDRAVQEADDDTQVRVLVIKGSGRAFSAGYDLSGTGRPGAYQGQRSLEESIYSLRRSGERWMRLLWYMRKPVIAQVHGFCLAGGNDLAGSCDIIIAAEDCIFGVPQARALGIHHTLGFWPLTIGLRKTKEIMYCGDAISGKEAERIGMVNRSVPEEKLEATVERLANRIAILPTTLLQSHKQCINRWYEIMGLDAMIRTADEFDAIASRAGPGDTFRQISQTQGLKAALENRDGPYGGAYTNWWDGNLLTPKLVKPDKK
ncbi:MAG: enoyl-CoA hydratase/isomerase family protein [Chloroflexi bacterium]|nr:enoyl-CoA hydratase/isomerase family protein [Chloroflexota bacterium]